MSERMLNVRHYAIGEVKIYQNQEKIASHYGNEHVPKTIDTYAKLLNSKSNLGKLNLISTEKDEVFIEGDGQRNSLKTYSQKMLTNAEEMYIFTGMVNAILINTLNSIWHTTANNCDKEDFYAMVELKKLLMKKINSENQGLLNFFVNNVYTTQDERYDYQYGDNIMMYEDILEGIETGEKGIIEITFTIPEGDLEKKGTHMLVNLYMKAYKSTTYQVLVPICVFPLEDYVIPDVITESSMESNIINVIHDLLNEKVYNNQSKYKENAEIIFDIIKPYAVKANNSNSILGIKYDEPIMLYRKLKSGGAEIFNCKEVETATLKITCHESLDGDGSIALGLLADDTIIRIFTKRIYEYIDNLIYRKYSVYFDRLDAHEITNWYNQLINKILVLMKENYNSKDYESNLYATDEPEIIKSKNKTGNLILDTVFSFNFTLPDDYKEFKVIVNLNGFDLHTIHMEINIYELYNSKDDMKNHHEANKVFKDAFSEDIYIDIDPEDIYIVSEGLFSNGELLENLVLLKFRLLQNLN